MAILARRLLERGIGIELDDDARTLLGNLGYDPTYGARPLKRVIQKQLVDKLALRMLEGEIGEGDIVKVGAADGELTFAGTGPCGRSRLSTPPAFSNIVHAIRRPIVPIGGPDDPPSPEPGRVPRDRRRDLIAPATRARARC